MGSGPDTTKRLLEYISIDDLPRSYGGNAPDLFPPRANIEYLHIARASTVKKVVGISSNQQLCIDAYITEGEFQLEVLSSVSKSSSSTAVTIGEITAPRSELHVLRDYEVPVTTTTGGTNTMRACKPTDMHVLYDANHKRPEGQTIPLRVQLDISVQSDATIHVHIINISKWSSKSVMLNIFTKTPIAGAEEAVKGDVAPCPTVDQSSVTDVTPPSREALPSLNSPILNLVQPADEPCAEATDELSTIVASVTMNSV